MSTRPRGAEGDAGDLEALLAEAAAARIARSLARCVEVVDAALASRDAGALAVVAPVIRSLDSLERITAVPPTEELDVAMLVERIATVQLIASPRLSFLRTSIPRLVATALVARCILAAVRELLHVLESGVAFDADGHEATLAAVVSDGFVTLVGASGPGAMPVTTCSGAAALARLGRLAEACGGTVRREVDDGCVRVGVALGVRLGPS